MKITLLRAVSVFAALAAILVLLATVGQEPVPVTVQWGGLHISTTAAVAITLMLLVLVTVFYTGRVAAWVINIPVLLRSILFGKRQGDIYESLLKGFAALYRGETDQATRIAKQLNFTSGTGTEPVPLITLLHLQTDTLPEARARETLSHPVLGPLVSLHLARKAAAKRQWEDVRELTSGGLRLAPSTPPLLVLHFKSLLNLNSPERITFLPQIKPLVTRNTYQLLSTIVAAGSSTPHAAALSHPWVIALQRWIPSPSEIFPDESKTPSR